MLPQTWIKFWNYANDIVLIKRPWKIVFAKGLLKSLTNLTLTVKNLYSKLGCFLGVLWYRIVDDFVHFWGCNEFKAIRRCHFLHRPSKTQKYLTSLDICCPRVSRMTNIKSSLTIFGRYFVLCSVCCDILKGALMALDLISVTAQKILLITEWTRNSNSLKCCTKRSRVTWENCPKDRPLLDW